MKMMNLAWLLFHSPSYFVYESMGISRDISALRAKVMAAIGFGDDLDDLTVYDLGSETEIDLSVDEERNLFFAGSVMLLLCRGLESMIAELEGSDGNPDLLLAYRQSLENIEQTLVMSGHPIAGSLLTQAAVHSVEETLSGGAK